MKNKESKITRRTALAAGVLLARPALAQEGWPNRPIRVVVPYPPGGGSDTVARLIYPRVSARLGQSIVIENRGGATGSIGEAAVARSDPDGYTLMHDAAAITVNPSLLRGLTFDVLRDFQPVTQAVTFPNLLLASPSVPVRTVAEVIAMAKASPRGLDWASSGPGSNQHLALVLFARAAGITVNHVPYRGGGPAVQDVIAGQIPFVFGSASGTTIHARSGAVRAIAHTGTGRLAALPDVPAVAETLADFEALDWQGVFVRRGTPEPIVERLADEIGAVLREPEIAERLTSLGAPPSPMRPAQFEAIVRADLEKWGRVVREAEIRLEG
ncbi:Bug family tripartite tricarboxylate transporter substrate binding protein [Roseomonas harenae]|jgi:tripartite-type tricarboxylate transporter receptor subunit TctC|uniref:Bug family tripartite tricarboxylate transporter substrate binding protein n=1 Tax=Muricoccus harenae TaxID=2692566 RepID=UPI0013317B28|nr:tripartite tricarboxylate transporter substrate binding protein [Roseomonas harenae]